MHALADMLQTLLWWKQSVKKRMCPISYSFPFKNMRFICIREYFSISENKKKAWEEKKFGNVSHPYVCARKGESSCCILMTWRQGSIYFQWYFPCEAVTTPIAFLHYLPENSERFAATVVPDAVGPGSNDQGY